MSAPAIGLRSRVLPSPNAHVDNTTPLGVGMIAALVPAHGIEMVSGRQLARGASTSLRATAWGVAAEQTAVSTPAYVVDVGAYPAQMSFVVVAHKLSGTSARQGLAVFNNSGSGAETGTQGFSVGISGSPNGWDSSFGTIGNTLTFLHHGVAWRPSTLAVPDGPVVVGGVRNTAGTSLVPYVNGVGDSAITLGTTPTGTLTVTAGTSSSSNRDSAAGRCPVVAVLVWNRGLSAGEMAAVAADPFQMFRQ